MRYAIKVDAYLYAENDEEAKAKAIKIEEHMQQFEDNNAKVIDLREIPFGSLTSREVASSNDLAKLIIEKHKKQFSNICK